MKRGIGIFFGAILMAVVAGMLWFAGAIYDAGREMTIEPYVFQPNNLSIARIGVPLSINQMNESIVRDALIKKFVMEYLYVVPDVDNVARRARSGAILSLMAGRDVFDAWVDNVVPELEQMATDKMLRTVQVASQIFKPAGSDYWTVGYELKTWNAANDMMIEPVVQRGALYLKVAFEKKLRDQMHGAPFDVREYLNNGGDPAAIFNFRVDAVAQEYN